LAGSARAHVLYKQPEIPAKKVVAAIAVSATYRKLKRRQIRVRFPVSRCNVTSNDRTGYWKCSDGISVTALSADAFAPVKKSDGCVRGQSCFASRQRAPASVAKARQVAGRPLREHGDHAAWQAGTWLENVTTPWVQFARISFVNFSGDQCSRLRICG
jgi:hypothetical protein